MIKLNCFLIAEYAAITADGRVTIAGTFDTVDVQRLPGAPDDALAQIPFPPAYVVAITEASIADGLSHQMRLRVVDGNGQPVMTDDIPIAVNYSLNQFGRPMRNNALINVRGLVLPGPDDYVFELYVDDQPGRFGEFMFSVAERIEPG